MTDDAEVSTTSGAEPAGYAEAMTELEAILDEIDREDVDVDLLTTRVARAAELIRWCRGRIEGAQVSVERIVAELATTSGLTGGTPGAGAVPTGATPDRSTVDIDSDIDADADPG